MSTILAFLFIFIMAIVAIVAAVLIGLVRNVSNIMNRFRSQTGHFRNDAQHSSHAQTRTADGKIIIDHKAEERSQQKIFKAGEGEYVDFVEEDT